MLDLLTIGLNISERRRSLKLTQLALAQKARTSRATLDALENQRIGELGFSRLMRILTVLDLELKLQQGDSQRPTLDELRAEDLKEQEMR